jgi:hypothetical protein
MRKVPNDEIGSVAIFVTLVFILFGFGFAAGLHWQGVMPCVTH